MKETHKHFIFLLSLTFFFISCKSVVVLPTKTPVKNVDISALASKIKSNYPRINKVRSRIKATYDDGKRERQIIVQFRLEEQKKIWMSASMIIPIAKLMITPEQVLFYEKFQKNYFKGSLDIINSLTKISFGYNDIENLFLGKPFSDPSLGRWKQVSNPENYILLPQGKRIELKPTLFFDPNTFLLKEQRFLILGTNQTLTIKYLNHFRIEGESLPQLIEITLFDGLVLKRLELEFTRTDFPDTLNFPFEIPVGYNQIEL
jgi:hypothetical protein